MLVAIAVTLCTRKGWVVPLTIAAAFIVTIGVEPGPDRTGREQLSWVDDAVGRDPDVLVVSAGIPARRCGAPPLGQLELWTEFFNVGAGRAVHLGAENPFTGLSSPQLRSGRTASCVRAPTPCVPTSLPSTHGSRSSGRPSPSSVAR